MNGKSQARDYYVKNIQQVEKMRKFCGVLLCQLFICLSVISSCFAGEGSYAVWSAAEGSEVNIFYSVLHDNQWSNPAQLTMGGTNVTPAITVDNDGIIWIVWVDFIDENRLLKYAKIQGNDIVQGRVSDALMELSYSPSIIVDRAHIPWIAWSSNTGTDEDIFFSRWNGASWDAPKQVNPDNKLPDITPTIGLGIDGRPWISWQRFNGDRYETSVAYWLDNHWDFTKSTNVKSNIQQKIMGRKAKLPQLPVQAKNRLMGSFFIPGSEEVQSISDRPLPLTTGEEK